MSEETSTRETEHCIYLFSKVISHLNYNEQLLPPNIFEFIPMELGGLQYGDKSAGFVLPLIDKHSFPDGYTNFSTYGAGNGKEFRIHITKYALSSHKQRVDELWELTGCLLSKPKAEPLPTKDFHLDPPILFALERGKNTRYIGKGGTIDIKKIICQPEVRVTFSPECINILLREYIRPSCTNKDRLEKNFALLSTKYKL